MRNLSSECAVCCGVFVSSLNKNSIVFTFDVKQTYPWTRISWNSLFTQFTPISKSTLIGEIGLKTSLRTTQPLNYSFSRSTVQYVRSREHLQKVQVFLILPAHLWNQCHPENMRVRGEKHMGRQERRGVRIQIHANTVPQIWPEMSLHIQ